MNRRLHELSAAQIASSLGPGSVLVQPVGAIEQHGPHLPLSTDLVIAESVAERVVEERGDELDLWLLPPLAYSKSDEHHWAPGTIWLSSQTLLQVLDDIGRSLATLPTKRLAFINGHGGNTALLTVANRDLRRKHGLMTFLLAPITPRDSGGESDAAECGMGVHGGRDETAAMLHLRPDLVDMSLAVRAVPEEMDAREHVKFGGSVPFGWLSDDLSTTGAIGDPTLADAEAGAAHVARAVRLIGEQLAEIATFEFPNRDHPAPARRPRRAGRVDRPTRRRGRRRVVRWRKRRRDHRCGQRAAGRLRARGRRRARRLRVHRHSRARERAPPPAAVRVPHAPGTRHVPMREWLPTMAAAYARVGVDGELANAAARVGLAESLLCGVTTVADHHLTWPAGADDVAIAEAPPRPHGSWARGSCSCEEPPATTRRQRGPARRRSSPVSVRARATAGSRWPSGPPACTATRRRRSRRCVRSPCATDCPAHASERAGRRRGRRRALRPAPARAARRLGLARGGCDRGAPLRCDR